MDRYLAARGEVVVVAWRRAVRVDAHTDTAGGEFERLYGKPSIRVNSLHGQGVLEKGGRINIEGVAEDGTIEAISVADARTFALGVQWHAEYDPHENPVNQVLFEAFGEALRETRAS